MACNLQRRQLLYRRMRDQNLPRASEEYDDADHDYVSTSRLVSGSHTETEPESLPVDIEGFSDIAHTRTHTHQWQTRGGLPAEPWLP
jgi:hypothetical protein